MAFFWIRYFCYSKKLSHHRLSGPEVPEEKISKCDAHKIFSATGKSVVPLTPYECVDDNILNASTCFVEFHKEFANYHGKLRKQVGTAYLKLLTVPTSHSYDCMWFVTKSFSVPGVFPVKTAAYRNIFLNLPYLCQKFHKTNLAIEPKKFFSC